LSANNEDRNGQDPQTDGREMAEVTGTDPAIQQLEFSLRPAERSFRMTDLKAEQ
jgi:hypothetical protein